MGAILMGQIVVITAVGQDRAGVIAALTGAVYHMGGNLDDATMTRLHGAFACMVSARLPDGATPADLSDALRPIAAELELAVTVQPVLDTHSDAPPDTLLTISGADKRGIVAQVTKALAARGVNITDMDTRVAGGANAPVYICLLEASVGNRDISADLDALRAALGVDIRARPLDSEAL